MVSTPDGGVLGRKTERVEAEGAQYGVALHRPVPDQDVAKGVVADVALVGGPTWVGVHAKHVVRRPGVVELYPVGAVLVPAPLPALFNLAKVVFRHGTRLVGRCGPLRGALRHEPRHERPVSSRRLSWSEPDADAAIVPPSTRRQFGRPTSARRIECWHPRGRSSVGRAPDWQSGGSRVRVPSPPPGGLHILPPRIFTFGCNSPSMETSWTVSEQALEHPGRPICSEVTGLLRSCQSS